MTQEVSLMVSSFARNKFNSYIFVIVGFLCTGIWHED
jgi:hypothetical protein